MNITYFLLMASSQLPSAALGHDDPIGIPEGIQRKESEWCIAAAVCSLEKRMLSGESALTLLASLNPKQPLLLEERHLAEAVQQEVEAAEAVDV
eukprot:s1856_g4.t1